MFDFLKRLFTGQPSAPEAAPRSSTRRTPLQEFIEDKCNVGSAGSVFNSCPNKQDGFASSLSILVLSLVKSVSDSLKGFPNLQNEMQLDKGWEAFDILAFEWTAWVHAYLLKVHRREMGVEFYDDEDTDPYDDCLMKSALYSQQFIQKFCKKTQPEGLFANRVINYCMVKNAVENLIQRLVWSLSQGEPQGKMGSSLGAVFLTVAVTALVANCQKTLDAVSTSAKQFYQSEVEE